MYKNSKTVEDGLHKKLIYDAVARMGHFNQTKANFSGERRQMVEVRVSEVFWA